MIIASVEVSQFADTTRETRPAMSNRAQQSSCSLARRKRLPIVHDTLPGRCCQNQPIRLKQVCYPVAMGVGEGGTFVWPRVVAIDLPAAALDLPLHSRNVTGCRIRGSSTSLA